MKEALKLALEALEVAFEQTCSVGRPKDWQQLSEAITALRTAIAEAEKQEPVAQGSIQHLKLMMEHSAWDGVIQLSDALANIDEFYTTPPAAQRQWVGLTDEDMETTHWSPDFRAGAKWAEAKLKEKNT